MISEIKPESKEGEELPPKLSSGKTVASLGRVEKMERMEKIRAYFDQTAILFNELKREDSFRKELAAIQAEEQKVLKSPSGKALIDLIQRYNAIGRIEDTVRMMRMAEDYREQHPGEPGDVQGSLLSGAVTSMMLVEVLQLLNRADKTGELVMESEGSKFQIYLQKGRIVHALSTSFLPGEESFYMAIRLQKGSYRFLEMSEMNMEATIEAKFDHLIMEAVRLMDESAAEGEAS